MMTGISYLVSKIVEVPVEAGQKTVLLLEQFHQAPMHVLTVTRV